MTKAKPQPTAAEILAMCPDARQGPWPKLKADQRKLTIEVLQGYMKAPERHSLRAIAITLSKVLGVNVTRNALDTLLARLKNGELKADS